MSGSRGLEYWWLVLSSAIGFLMDPDVQSVVIRRGLKNLVLQNERS